MAMNKLFGMLGLARRAGKVAFGIDEVVNNVRNGNAKLVIVSVNSSPATQKKITDKCNSYNVDYFMCCTSDEIGNAIGKDICSAVAVTDNNFAEAIRQIYDKMTEVAE